MRTAGAKRAALFMILPSVLVLLLVGLFPVIFAVTTSFRDYVLTSPGDTPFVGFDNYSRALNSRLFWMSLGRTGLFFVVVITFQLVLGMMIALLFDRTGWHRLSKVMRVLLVFPIAVTPAVLGLAGRLIFNRDFGVMNYFVELFGGDPVSWLGDPSRAMITIMMVDTWQWTPFAALVLAAGLTMVPSDIYEAASLETDSFWRIFLHIQLPFLLPGLTTILIIRTAEVLKLFDMVFILTRGGPGVSTELISVYIQRVGFRIFDMGLASAQAILLLILCIGLSQVFVKYFYREVHL
jgi:multiple sugar transport system permease protein